MQIYQVGGSIRDRILKRQSNDIDWVVVGSDEDEMLSLGFEKVGKDFPVFFHPITKEEYALARTERKNGKGYNGFTVDFSKDITLEDDLQRRDLTINSIALDKNGNYIDPCNGIEDIKDKILRHNNKAFIEDPLRVIRVARFQTMLPDFSIDPHTLAAMKSMAESGELQCLTKERLLLEMNKVYKYKNTNLFYQTLFKANALCVYGKNAVYKENTLIIKDIPLYWRIAIDCYYNNLDMILLPYSDNIKKAVHLLNKMSTIEDFYNDQIMVNFIKNSSARRSSEDFICFIKIAQAMGKIDEERKENILKGFNNLCTTEISAKNKQEIVQIYFNLFIQGIKSKANFKPN